MSILELLAALLGIAAVALTIARSVWCWPVGLTQVLLYTKVFFDAKLYSQTWLQVVFTILQLYGWWQWRQSLRGESGSDRSTQVHVAKLSYLAFSSALAVALVLSLSLGFSMQHWTDAKWPIADATIAGTSLVAQWLLIQRYLQNWYLWIVVDILTIVVCAAQELWLTVVLYLIFLGMATGGWLSWRKQWINQQAASGRTSNLDANFVAEAP